ncbi:peptide deformylase [Candidatus Curtissbacteria bacterium]|nr:peptide deformylase [Candidatus Curtissbacteria bacterium]
MIRTFTALPDEKIRQKSDAVIAFDKSLANLIGDLTQTAQVQENPTALGLAAPQIGVAKRVFVIRIKNKFKPFVNARLIRAGKKQGAYLEGCFSVPGIYGHVIRPLEVTVEAQDKGGKSFTKTYKGLAARIIQHEIDHLSGRLFVDHTYEQNGKLFKIEKDKKGKEQLVEILYP